MTDYKNGGVPNPDYEKDDVTIFNDITEFTDDVFIQSVNKSKWHIFGTCVSDLLFYTCSYLKSENKIGNLSLQNIYEDIIRYLNLL